MKSSVCALALILAAAPAALAQTVDSEATRAVAAQIAALKDTPYPGAIKLSVDVTDTARGIMRVKETVPVEKPGRLTLLLPAWLPGDHSPTGQIDKIGGLIIKANGQRLEWKRDPANVYAFHVEVPSGAAAVDVEFQYLSPVAESQGSIVLTRDLLNLEWNSVALYPAGYATRRITVEPSLTLPQGWTWGGALRATGPSAGNTVTFQPVTFETLVDSPLFAGRYGRVFDLDPGAARPVKLNVFADRPEFLEATPAQVDIHRALVKQAYKVFGSQHYDRYDFLLALSDELGGVGLEHHRSSQNGVGTGYFTDWAKMGAVRDLLAHEFTHSWNGKFRRGADLITPSFNVPMQDSLLWVYEGQTQYWGYVLGARSGLLSKQEALDAIALTAAQYDHRAGRAWRALEDTTNAPIIAQRRPLPWTNWLRSEDYYSEGELVWLDVDTVIREQSKGKRSLDDFAKAFFGVNDGSFEPLAYRFEDVVATLNQVQPYDWASFLKTRLKGHGPGAPLDGIARGGYRLTYAETPNAAHAAAMAGRGREDLSYSLGLSIGKDGAVADVLWDSPAFGAGVRIGAQIMAVNGLAYDGDKLKAAITAAKSSKAPIELILKEGERFRTVQIAYHDGLRYPKLERVPGTPARLDEILAARR